MARVKAPWTDDQVKRLNEWQQTRAVHPFTCGTSKCRGILRATTSGWVCPKCSYVQNWALKISALKDPDPPCEHAWEEQPGEPPRDVCVNCGETQY